MNTVHVPSAASVASEAVPRLGPLKRAALIFAVGGVAHNLDHLRRGLDVITPQLLGGGALVGIASAIAVLLVFVGHRDAARTSVLVGFVTAVAVGASHLLPKWGVLSDPLPGSSVDGWTWAAILLVIGGSILLGVSGLRAVRAQAGGA